MRIIKFRVWDGERMWTGRAHESAFRLAQDGELCADDLTTSYLVGCEVMQFTGLHDAEGNPIYEGDVVEFEDGETLSVSWCNDLNGYALESQNQAGGHTLRTATARSYRVVGNIYEQEPEAA